MLRCIGVRSPLRVLPPDCDRAGSVSPKKTKSPVKSTSTLLDAGEHVAERGQTGRRARGPPEVTLQSQRVAAAVGSTRCARLQKVLAACAAGSGKTVAASGACCQQRKVDVRVQSASRGCSSRGAQACVRPIA